MKTNTQMKKIEAKIVADSISPQGHRITTMLLTYPRFIHGEIMTHRLFSRNSASSRAIPFKKMIEMVETDPFIPIAWQKEHKGMQGAEYLTDEREVAIAYDSWINGRDNAVISAKRLNSAGVTKQITNRILEPFMWHTVLITSTEFSNFLNLRCPQYKFPDVNRNNIFKSKKKVIAHFNNTMYWEEFWKQEATIIDWLKKSISGAEIHIQALAESMWDVMNESVPNKLEAGEWHMPFIGNFDNQKLLELSGQEPEAFELVCRKIATARAARLSYMTFDNEMDYKKDMQLHDQLLAAGHMSPFEHCARTMTDEEYYSFIKGEIPIGREQDGTLFNHEQYPKHSSVNSNKFGWCNNFRGFIQYRYLIENEIN